jgi:hypothetical protein
VNCEEFENQIKGSINEIVIPKDKFELQKAIKAAMKQSRKGRSKSPYGDHIKRS